MSNKTIALRLDPDQLRAWHLKLATRIEVLQKTPVVIVWGQSQMPCPPSDGVLFEFERLIHRLPSLGLMTRITVSSFSHLSQTLPLNAQIIDLCGGPDRLKSPAWQLTYDGMCGEGAALSALLNGRPPRLQLVMDDISIADAQPGVESANVRLSAMNDIAARTISFIIASLSRAHTTQPNVSALFATRRPATSTMILAEVAKGLARTVAKQLLHLCYNTPHWKVGWRFTRDFDFILTGRHPDTGWNTVPDDGHHFYADPFPVIRNGKTHMFVESFCHKDGFGHIAVMEFDQGGRPGAARPALNLGSHLSYPFVFEAEGEMWLMPESSTKRNLILYRAAHYPDSWVPEVTLLEDLEVSDATLVEHQGKWWMLASVRDDGGSYSDTLHIWSASNFRGPWHAHVSNPILIDAARARPAGSVFRLNDRLMRPVQDCASYYGKSVAMMEITRLDHSGFEQSEVSVLKAGSKWPGRRLHIFNRAGALEVIDGSAWGRKF